MKRCVLFVEWSGMFAHSVLDIEQNWEGDSKQMWKQVASCQPEDKQILLCPVGEFSGTWMLPVRLIITVAFDNISSETVEEKQDAVLSMRQCFFHLQVCCLGYKEAVLFLEMKDATVLCFTCRCWYFITEVWTCAKNSWDSWILLKFPQSLELKLVSCAGIVLCRGSGAFPGISEL